MESNKTILHINLTEKNKMDTDRAYVKKTHQQYREKSRPVESTRTKEKRQAQENMEKGSGAGDEGGTSHMGRNGDNSS